MLTTNIIGSTLMRKRSFLKMRQKIPCLMSQTFWIYPAHLLLLMSMHPM